MRKNRGNALMAVVVLALVVGFWLGEGARRSRAGTGTASRRAAETKAAVDDDEHPARGPVLWEPGRYRLTLVKGSDLVVKYAEIGWSIPPGWMVRTVGPMACGSGALRPLFKIGGKWAFGSAIEFDSGWQSYRLPFGLYATYMASGNASAGAHVNTVHAGIYPPDARFIRVTPDGPSRWRVGMDFWTDGQFDDLEMLLEKVD